MSSVSSAAKFAFPLPPVRPALPPLELRPPPLGAPLPLPVRPPLSAFRESEQFQLRCPFFPQLKHSRLSTIGVSGIAIAGRAVGDAPTVITFWRISSSS